MLTTIALGFVVFAVPLQSYGVWDDLAFLVSALIFLWSVVRLLGARASDTARAAHPIDDERREAVTSDQRHARVRGAHRPNDPS